MKFFQSCESHAILLIESAVHSGGCVNVVVMAKPDCDGTDVVEAVGVLVGPELDLAELVNGFEVLLMLIEETMQTVPDLLQTSTVDRICLWTTPTFSICCP